jgi:putative copper export protein
MALLVQRLGSVVALIAIAMWMGGLVALGALAAPVVFSMVPFPASADAMTTVFRRFDVLAMGCATVLLATEAVRALFGTYLSGVDRARAALSVVAAALAVIEGSRISPRIAALHAGGAVRGLGTAGLELSRLHDWAERLGEGELWLLALVVALQVVALSTPAPRNVSSRVPIDGSR